MPGKVNPVIPEYVISSAHKIYSNDTLISNLSGQGCLELNAYIPVIGNAIIESLKLLISCNKTIKENLIIGLSIEHKTALENLMISPSITTALLPFIGYHKSAMLANKMKDDNISIIKANDELKLIDSSKLKEILSPQYLLKSGFTIKDITRGA